MAEGSIFFHSISEDVAKALTTRQAAYSARNRGAGSGADGYSPALKWGYMKEAYVNLYWHCPSGKKKDELIVGSDFARDRKKFSKSTPGNHAPLYNPVKGMEDGRYFPIPLIQDVGISNEGRIGSLQKANVSIKCFNMKQFENLEKRILFPGADVKIIYGWTGGLGPKSTTEDTFIGIIDNFSWSMAGDLSIEVSFSAVGRGFASNSIPSTGQNEGNKDYAEDEQNNKIYADSFASKIKADLANLKDKVNKPGFYTSAVGGYEMVYGVQKFKYDSSTEIKKPEKGKSKVKPPDEQTVTYVKLSDIFNYFNEVVIKKIPRLSDGADKKLVRFSANYGISKETGVGGDQEFVGCEKYYLPVSISMYDEEVVSSDPGSILFNDAACYTDKIYPKADPNWGFWKIEDGPGPKEFARFKRGENNISNQDCKNNSGVNLGEILVSTTLLLTIIENLSVNAQDPISKSVQALGNEIFKKINEVSSGLYQLSWTEVEVKKGTGESAKSENWICVTDPSFSVCDPDVWLFSVDKPDKTLVRQVSLSSKIPGGQQTALYVGGRSTGATDGNFSSAAKISGREADVVLCNMLEDISNDSKKKPSQREIDQMSSDEKLKNGIADNGGKKDDLPSIGEARKAMGTSGCTELTRTNLKGAITKYLSEQKSMDKSGGNGDRYSFMRRDLYPLECSITLDGIAGFRFGDAVMINYVPQRYRGVVCFVVTKTNHKISNNKWETTLTLNGKIHGSKPKYMNGDMSFGNPF